MKTTMKKPLRLWCKGSAVMMLTLVALSGCGGGSGGNAQSANTVPDSVGGSGPAFTGFVQTLSPADETSEPLAFNTTFAEPPVDETAEPTL